jgi:riboflavin synthase
MIIPHTWEHTNLSKFKVGDSANIEVDVLSKYVAQYVDQYVAQHLGKTPS